MFFALRANRDIEKLNRKKLIYATFKFTKNESEKIQPCVNVAARDEIVMEFKINSFVFSFGMSVFKMLCKKHKTISRKQKKILS